MACDDPRLVLVEAPRLVRELYGARADSNQGPSAVELQVLVCIDGRRSQRVEDIAAALGLRSSTVSHALRRLRALGLVEERQALTDARRHTRKLTAAGRAKKKRLVAHARKLLGALSDEVG